MPAILESVSTRPPQIFVIQTRGTLILRDVALLQQVARCTTLRISFSVTTDRDEIRQRYEPHCEPNQVRLTAIRDLRNAGLEVYATLAPLLPCDPEQLAGMAIEASGRDLIGDPLHVRETKQRGATTRHAAFQIAQRHCDCDWFKAEFQERVVARIERVANNAGVQFATGPQGFSRLARRDATEWSRMTDASDDPRGPQLA